MLVRCVTRNATDLGIPYLDPRAGYGPEAVFELTLGKEYVVYALTIRNGGIWYYVIDESGVEYPIWHPAPLFQVADPRVSRYWTFGFSEGGLRAGSALFAYGEWAREPAGYYDRLTDGNPEALQIFRVYRELFELEFAIQSVEVAAEGLPDGWLHCPNCRESWREPVRGEMLRCPACRQVLLNPALLRE
jgi:hypothetical protein